MASYANSPSTQISSITDLSNMETTSLPLSPTPDTSTRPPPGYPANPQFTLTTSTSSSTSDSNGSSPNPPVQGKVMIKNTFITVNSVNPPSSVRNRTFSSDAILFGTRFTRPTSEYFIYSQTPTFEKETLTGLHISSFASPDKSPVNMDPLVEEDNDTKLVYSQFSLDSPTDSPLSSQDTFEIEKSSSSSLYSNSTHNQNPVSPHLNKNSTPFVNSGPSNSSIHLDTSVDLSPTGMNSTTNKNDILGPTGVSHHALSPSTTYSSMTLDEKLLHNTNNFKESADLDFPVMPQLKADSHNIDSSSLNITRDPKFQVSNPGLIAKELGSKKTNLTDFPMCNNGYTTLMLRNIPNKYTQNMLLKVIDEEFQNLYDFFYLPIDFRNKCNVGYAFINFIHPYFAELFWQKFDNYKLTAFKSNKVCAVTWGRVQGLQSNIEHYRNSAVMTLSSAQYKPMLFQNGMEAPFPSSNRPVPEVKLRGKK